MIINLQREEVFRGDSLAGRAGTQDLSIMQGEDGKGVSH